MEQSASVAPSSSLRRVVGFAVLGPAALCGTSAAISAAAFRWADFGPAVAVTFWALLLLPALWLFILRRATHGSVVRPFVLVFAVSACLSVVGARSCSGVDVPPSVLDSSLQRAEAALEPVVCGLLTALGLVTSSWLALVTAVALSLLRSWRGARIGA